LIDYYYYRHSPAPRSVAVIGDKVFWTDQHYKDVLFHRKGDTVHNHERITVDASPLTDIVAVDATFQPSGL